MKRFSLLFAPLPLVSLACSQEKTTVRPEKPNIVMIVSDDHGQNDLGCYGNKAIHTPNLDYLASTGIRFTNAYCTSASCSASRSVILTGLYNHANGQYGHSHGVANFKTFESVRSLPVILSEYGYSTARAGKFHVAPEEVYAFDRLIPGDSRNCTEMALNSKAFLDENKNSPFFLYFCASDPHRGGGFVDENPYRPDRFGNRKEGYTGIEEKYFTPDEVEVPWYLPDNPATRAELAQYYQSVARMDQGIGTLFNLLKEKGLWDNTIILYLSDNGIAFHGAKTNTYDPAIRLPFIVKMPDETHPGSVTNAMVSWSDLTPTLLDLAGILNLELEKRKSLAQPTRTALQTPIHSTFHGKSFLPVLKNPQVNGFDEIYASHTFHEITMYYPMRVVETRDYKLIWNLAHELGYPHASDLWESATWQEVQKSGDNQYGKRNVEDYLNRPEFELFNKSTDPYESINLAYNPQYSKVLEELKEKIKAFQEKTNDPWIIKWTHE
jgi:N-sulfoglucosamine sulfohydrolase